MPKQRKELGDYKEKIQEYLRTNKDNLKKCTKQELNLEWQHFLGLFFGRHLVLIINWS